MITRTNTWLLPFPKINVILMTPCCLSLFINARRLHLLVLRLIFVVMNKSNKNAEVRILFGFNAADSCLPYVHCPVLHTYT